MNMRDLKKDVAASKHQWTTLPPSGFKKNQRNENNTTMLTLRYTHSYIFSAPLHTRSDVTQQLQHREAARSVKVDASTCPCSQRDVSKTR